MLGHEKLDVYQCSIEFFALAASMAESVPRGYGELKSQLRRASLSVPLNIAEGAGKVSDADSAKFYAIARGSAQECGAILDALDVLGAVEGETYSNGKTLLYRLVSMLTRMSDIPESNRPD